MKKKYAAAALFLALALGLVGCGQSARKGEEPRDSGAEVGEAHDAGGASDTRESVEINVSVAASLTDCAAKLAEAFHEENPDIRINFNYGSAGKLQQQIEEGAPADLFISAGQKQVDALEEKGLIDKDTRVNLLENKVVLIVPRDSKLELTSFDDVARDDVKMIAIGESSVPVGQYAEEIFKHLGIWDEVKAKANYGQDVRNVLAWVEEDQADCGVVYATDAAITDKVRVVCEAPEGSHKPVIYPACVLKDARQPEAAKRFLAFLKTEKAAGIFEKFGFQMAKR